MVCRPSVICATAVKGSTPRSGIAACVPWPCTVISKVSSAAIMGPWLIANVPAGRPASCACRRPHRTENARTGRPAPWRGRRPRLFRRLENEMHGAAEAALRRQVAGGAQQHGGVAVMPAGGMVPAWREQWPKVLSSSSGSASMSARSAMAGPGAVESVPTTHRSRPGRDARRCPWRTVRARPGRRCGARERQLRMGVQVAAPCAHGFHGIGSDRCRHGAGHGQRRQALCMKNWATSVAPMKVPALARTRRRRCASPAGEGRNVLGDRQAGEGQDGRGQREEVDIAVIAAPAPRKGTAGGQQHAGERHPDHGGNPAATRR